MVGSKCGKKRKERRRTATLYSKDEPHEDQQSKERKGNSFIEMLTLLYFKAFESFE